MLYPAVNDPEFALKLIAKEEFNEIKHHKTPEEKIMGLMPHQIFVSRFISPATPYKSLLIAHATGSGKTWSIATIVDKFSNIMKKSIILLQGDTSVTSFKLNIFEWYKSYFGRPGATESEINNYIENNYDIQKYMTFARVIKNMDDHIITLKYSNRIIIIDEAHKLNTKNVGQEKEDKKLINLQITKLTSLIQNSRIIVSTATCIVDSDSEIYSLLNIILPPNERFNQNNSNLENLKSKLYGRISYYDPVLNNDGITSRQPRVIEKGVKIKGRVERYILLRMEGKQRSVYANLPETIKNVYVDRIDASLMILPVVDSKENVIDIITNKKDLHTVFTHSEKSTGCNTFKDSNLVRFFSEIQDQLYEYSCKLGFLIDCITQDKLDEKVFVFCSIVSGFGIESISAILVAMGFEFYNKGEILTTCPRFTVITGSVYSSNKNDIIYQRLNKYNDKNNKYGHYIKVLLVSDIASESLTLKSVRQVHVLTPFWNSTKQLQVVARAIRISSHDQFEKEVDRYTKIFRYLAVEPDNNEYVDRFTISRYEELDSISHLEMDITKIGNNVRSVDIYQAKTSHYKYINVMVIEQMLKNASIDFHINNPVRCTDSLTIIPQYYYIPVRPLFDYILNKLKSDSYITLDTLLESLQINQLSLIKVLIKLSKSEILVKIGNTYYKVQLYNNVLYLDYNLTRKDPYIIPISVSTIKQHKVEYLNMNTNNTIDKLTSINNSISLVKDLMNAISKQEFRIDEVIKYSITNNLENIKEVTKCGWIYVDTYYTMINYRCNSSTNYTTGGDLTDKIADHVIMLKDNTWIKCSNINIVKKLIDNYNVHRRKYMIDNNISIYSNKNLSDCKTRIMYTYIDKENKRKSKRGRCINNYNKPGEIGFTTLYFILDNLSTKQMLEVCEYIGDNVTYNFDAFIRNTVQLNDETDPIKTYEYCLENYPLFTYIFIYVIENKRDVVTKFITWIIDRFELYTVMV